MATAFSGLARNHRVGIALAKGMTLQQAIDSLGGEVAEGSETPRGARQLLEQAPEGIDACARMESADRAVLSNLKP